MKCKCVTKCFYKIRLWKPGETLVIPKGETVPKHFVAVEKFKPVKKVSEKEAEMKVVKSVGHKKPSDPNEEMFD